MDFSEALELVKKADNGDEIVSAILERDRKRGASEKSLRERLSAYEGIEPDAHRNIVETLKSNGIDTSKDIGEQLKGLSQGKSSEVEKVMLEINSLKKTLDEEKKRAADLERLGKREKLFNSLFKSFDEKVLAGDLALERLLDKEIIDFTTDGKPAYRRGDEIITDDIVSAYLSDNPHHAKNGQKPGAGASPNNDGAGSAEDHKQKISHAVDKALGSF